MAVVKTRRDLIKRCSRVFRATYLSIERETAREDRCTICEKFQGGRIY